MRLGFITTEAQQRACHGEYSCKRLRFRKCILSGRHEVLGDYPTLLRNLPWQR